MQGENLDKERCTTNVGQLLIREIPLMRYFASYASLVIAFDDFEIYVKRKPHVTSKATPCHPF